MLKRLLTVISLLLLTTVVTACNTNTKSSGNHEKIQVVATVDFYGEVAKAVGSKYKSRPLSTILPLIRMTMNQPPKSANKWPQLI